MEKRITMTQDEMLDIAKSLIEVQQLPEPKRIAVKYYLKGMMDNTLLEASVGSGR